MLLGYPLKVYIVWVLLVAFCHLSHDCLIPRLWNDICHVNKITDDPTNFWKHLMKRDGNHRFTYREKLSHARIHRASRSLLIHRSTLSRWIYSCIIFSTRVILIISVYNYSPLARSWHYIGQNRTTAESRRNTSSRCGCRRNLTHETRGTKGRKDRLSDLQTFLARQLT